MIYFQAAGKHLLCIFHNLSVFSLGQYVNLTNVLHNTCTKYASIDNMDFQKSVLMYFWGGFCADVFVGATVVFFIYLSPKVFFIYLSPILLDID